MEKYMMGLYLSFINKKRGCRSKIVSSLGAFFRLVVNKVFKFSQFTLSVCFNHVTLKKERMHKHL